MRYLRLLLTFCSASVRAELEYRSNAVSGALNSMFWLAWALGSIVIMYRYDDVIAGWNYDEALIVMAMFYAMNGYRQAFIQPNISRISEMVRTGSLDFLLLKPVSSQFLVSFRHISIFNVLDMVIGVVVALIIAGASGHLSPATGLSFVVFFGLGLLALHSLALGMHSLTIWMTSSVGIDNILRGSLEVARLPLDFYPRPLRIVLMTILPVGLATTVPALALVGRLTPVSSVAAVGVVVALFAAACWIWRSALGSYTSAGG